MDVEDDEEEEEEDAGLSCEGVLDVEEVAIILLVSVAWGFLAAGHPARCHRQNTPTRASKHLHFTSATNVIMGK